MKLPVNVTFKNLKLDKRIVFENAELDRDTGVLNLDEWKDVIFGDNLKEIHKRFSFTYNDITFNVNYNKGEFSIGKFNLNILNSKIYKSKNGLTEVYFGNYNNVSMAKTLFFYIYDLSKACKTITFAICSRTNADFQDDYVFSLNLDQNGNVSILPKNKIRLDLLSKEYNMNLGEISKKTIMEYLKDINFIPYDLRLKKARDMLVETFSEDQLFLFEEFEKLVKYN